MTQAEFAESIGISQGTLANFTGKRASVPGADVIAKILETYPDVNIAYILTGQGEMFLPKEESPALESRVNDLEGRVTAIENKLNT